jgi:hypothetical protein
VRSILPWRSRAVLWLFIPTILCVYLYSRSYVDPINIVGYWTSVGSGSAIFLLFSCTFASVSAAFEGSRWRRARLSSAPNVRSTIWVLFVQLGPVICLGCLAQLFGFLILARGTWGSPGHPPLILIPTFVAIILFHVALGYMLGRLLPTAIGIAAALFASYAWLGFTWASSYAPPRYLAGLVISDCCSVERQLDPASAIVAFGFNALTGVVLVVAVTALPQLRRIPQGVCASTAVIAVGAITAVSLSAASGLGYTSDRPRSMSEAVCAGREPKVCLFPEQTHYRDPTAAIRTAAANMTQAGIAVPQTIRPASAASSRTTLNMIVNPHMSDGDLIHSFAAAFMPPTVAAYCGDQRDYERRMATAGAVSRWLGDTASKGIVDPSLVQPIVPDGAAEARQLRKLPASAQVNWVIENLSAITDCTRQITSLPQL